MNPLLIITGPTASGKSTFALRLAQRVDGEIISADSMQIYRGCDIATAKPSQQEQTLIPHHLIDIVEPTVRFSAAMWAQSAREAVDQIRARQKVPIIVGGTGFYLRALVDPQHLAPVPPNMELRASLEKLENQVLWEKLRLLDAPAAARLEAANTQRVIRAIEVAMAPKVSVEQKPLMAYRAFALQWPRDVLYERINHRVDAMLHAGLLQELKLLREKYGADAPALQGIGYKEMVPVLEDANLMEEQTKRLKQATRHYAKRQMTWFRHQLEVQWLDAMNGEQEGNDFDDSIEKYF